MERVFRAAVAACLSIAFAAACSSTNSTGFPTSDAGQSGQPGDETDSGTTKTDAGKVKADAGKEEEPKDAAVKEAAAPVKDVADSTECDAYCAKVEACGSTCVPKDDCKVPTGQCAASVKERLDCEATTGQWVCGSGGFSIIHNCKYDPTLCE